MTMYLRHSEKKEEKSEMLRLLSHSGRSINWLGQKIMAKGLHGFSKKTRTLNWTNAHENEKKI